MVESNGIRFLFDPFINGNPLATHISIKAIKCDYIFVSHAHKPHTGDLVKIYKQTNATLIASYEVIAWAQECLKFHAMNYGAYTFDFGEVRMVPAVHSSTFPDGSYGGLACGFVLKLPEGNFYYAGDTGLTRDMELIPKYFAKLDFAILPIGGNFTMNVDIAIIASNLIECNKIIGVHYDTFDYIKIDKELAVKKFADAGKELILVKIGDTIEL
jgi:L-ascorbate metabolism protein UlaG (beta-lactamase superfamily)